MSNCKRESKMQQHYYYYLHNYYTIFAFYIINLYDICLCLSMYSMLYCISGAT